MERELPYLVWNETYKQYNIPLPCPVCGQHDCIPAQIQEGYSFGKHIIRIFSIDCLSSMTMDKLLPEDFLVYMTYENAQKFGVIK